MKENLFKTIICESKKELGRLAGTRATHYLQQAIQSNGQANLVMATGTSQYDTLAYLITQKDIDWSKVVMFHLDEYIGINSEHPASFARYLKERFLDHLPPLKKTFLINGTNIVDDELAYLNEQIKLYPTDLALIGIGENGHLAFNDPPADFESTQPFIKVTLDEDCRMQQVNEGWYVGLEAVPTHAISMTIKQILAAKAIVASVPDQRKAQAVYNTLFKAIDPMYPSTILRTHPQIELFLDTESASSII